jgi:hypothetical protein
MRKQPATARRGACAEADVGALPPDRKRQWSWSSAGSGSSTKGAATVDWQRSGCDLCCNLQLWRGLRTSP